MTQQLMATGAAARTPSFGTPYDVVFVDDGFTTADEARLSVLANAVSYGTGTFEGIRASWNPARQELFLLEAEEDRHPDWTTPVYGDRGHHSEGGGTR